MYVHCVSSFTVRPIPSIVCPLYHCKLIIFYIELLWSRLFTTDLLFINILLFIGVCRHWYKHLHADLAISYTSAVNLTKNKTKNLQPRHNRSTSSSY